ncbi:hypothetical protein E2562_024513 [Oryza meyeriana var. granulata]|uniref:KIB1-4 beta-propeller domain-containing protein n=1 Tax=Oryza meyeriana var. granulata TaxID=110450 RepID=A0A6G1BND7_9ORYZ|nr:hypothetical protein E2562_024513 [Oryza meyeriana var. granulata]
MGIIGPSKATPTAAAPASRPLRLSRSDLPTDLADLVLLRLPPMALRRGGDAAASTTPWRSRSSTSATASSRASPTASYAAYASRATDRYNADDVVACCHPAGTSSLSSWSTGPWQGKWYHDMTIHDGKLYTVSGRGDLEVTICRDTGQPVVSDRVTPVI